MLNSDIKLNYYEAWLQKSIQNLCFLVERDENKLNSHIYDSTHIAFILAVFWPILADL